MAQGLAADDEENDERARRGQCGADPHHNHDANHEDSHRWPTEPPSAEVARVALKIDQAITSKRSAAAAWLATHSHTVPSLPNRPSRMELAVLIALAETFGIALYQDPRFVPVLDFIADCGAVALVQRVMYGARLDSDNSADFDVTPLTAENTRLTEVLRDACVAFEFLCATWPEVFLAQTHAVLEGIGVRVLPVDAGPMPSSAGEETADDEEGDGEGRDKGDDADEEDGDG